MMGSCIELDISKLFTAIDTDVNAMAKSKKKQPKPKPKE